MQLQNKRYCATFSAKLFFLCWLVLVSIITEAQQLNHDYRKKLQTASTPIEKWKALASLNRYYLTRGNMDSCAITSQEMLRIALQLKSDTLASDTYNIMANAFIAKSDYNFALQFYLKALALNKKHEAILNSNIGGVYISTGNYTEALKYLRKSLASANPADTSISYRSKAWTYGYLSNVFNRLHQPDSALFFGQLALSANKRKPEDFVYPGILYNLGLAHQQLSDNDLAEAYYKKAIAFSDSTHNPLFLSKASIEYGKLLIKQDNYPLAKYISKKGLDAAVRSNDKGGIADAAEVLRKIYNHLQQKDSAYYYADMRIVYKDSIASQEKVNEIQNMTFAKQLEDNEEKIKAEQAKEEREQNIQYGLIAIVLLTFLILFFLLSRSIIVNARMIEFLGVLALLIVFEFINLLLHPFLASITHHSPVLMLLAMVCIAALLVPTHHYIEKWVTHKLVEKNKVVRLAAAKKTIEKLEGTPITKV